MRPEIAQSNSTIDRRTYPTSVADIQFRSAEDGTTSLVGYAINYNRRSELLYGMFYEEIATGAFDESCRNGDIRAFWSHDSSIVLGRTKSRTLECVSDEIGVRFSITPPTNAFIAHCVESMRRGDVDQMSFGFYTNSDEDEEWSTLKDGTYLRRVKRGTLVEISPVAIPAYSTTSVAVSERALHRLKAVREVQDLEVRSANRLQDLHWKIRMASARLQLGRI